MPKTMLDAADLAARARILAGALGDGTARTWPKDVVGRFEEFAAGKCDAGDLLSTLNWHRTDKTGFSAAACRKAYTLGERMAAHPKPSPIVFLDIDGVVMTRRALAHPDNIALYEALKGMEGQEKAKAKKDLPLSLAFDAAAIHLLVRLCSEAGAKIVLHTNWRRNVGCKETKETLVRQGLPEEFFHRDYYCTFRMTSEKGHDIHEWLSDHRTAFPKHPPAKRQRKFWETTERQRKEDARRNPPDWGFSFVVIDDEGFRGFQDIESRHVRTGMDDGFSPKHYRTALALLGGSDPELGCDAVSQDAFDRTLAAFEGDRLAACAWLWADEPDERWGKRPPNPDTIRRDAEAMRLFGYGFNPEEAIERAGAAFAESLAKIAALERKKRGPRRPRRVRTIDDLNF